MWKKRLAAFFAVLALASGCLWAAAETPAEELERLRKEQQQMDQLNASQDESKRLEQEYAQALQQADEQMSAAQAEKESYEKASAEKEQEIAEAERRYAQWAAQDDNPGVEFTGGAFVWPLSGYTTNSPRGWRTDPFTGQQSFHRGTDIPAPKCEKSAPAGALFCCKLAGRKNQASCQTGTYCSWAGSLSVRSSRRTQQRPRPVPLARYSIWSASEYSCR